MLHFYLIHSLPNANILHPFIQEVPVVVVLLQGHIGYTTSLDIHLLEEKNNNVFPLSIHFLTEVMNTVQGQAPI